MNYSRPDTRTLHQRLLARLFPMTSLAIPEDDLPGFAPAYLLTVTEAQFDWRDRLRVLVSGKIRVTVRTHTDVPVAKSQSVSCVVVLP